MKMGGLVLRLGWKGVTAIGAESGDVTSVHLFEILAMLRVCPWC